MSKPRFYLKDKNASSETLVFMYWYLHGQQFKYSTGIKIQPRFWSAKRELVSDRHPYAVAYNSRIKRLTDGAILSHEAILVEHGTFSKDLLRKALDVVKTGQTSESTIKDFFDAFVAKKDADPRIAVDTVRHYSSSFKHFLAFAKTDGLSSFDLITHKTWERFEQWLLAKGMANNSLLKNMSRVKTAFKAAIKEGVTDNQMLLNLEATTKREEAVSVYLTAQELEKLAAIDYSQNKRLEKARDLFLIGCYTGLRYSDFSRLSSDYIRETDGHQMIYFNNKKTKVDVVIPVRQSIIAILDKYGGEVPKLSRQKLGDYIKEIGESCGFLDELVQSAITKGGVRESKLVPKWQLLGTHTARRSFATNAFLDGWPTISIMQITGHKTESEFMKYIKVSKEQNALRIAKMLTKKY